MFLYEMLGSWKNEYKQLTYIDTPNVQSDYLKVKSKKIAIENKWKYNKVLACENTQNPKKSYR